MILYSYLKMYLYSSSKMFLFSVFQMYLDLCLNFVKLCLSIAFNWYYFNREKRSKFSYSYCMMGGWWDFDFYFYRSRISKNLMLTYSKNIQAISMSFSCWIIMRSFEIFLGKNFLFSRFIKQKPISPYCWQYNRMFIITTLSYIWIFFLYL